MGRELALQLASEGCHLAVCDFIVENLLETKRMCDETAPPGTVITAHECDVADENQVIVFREAMEQQHGTTHINLLFNNAGVGGGGSFILDNRKDWDRTFAVDWSGVYYCTRAFLPLLLNSKEGHIINISSVNGFYACLGHETSHTAYSTAKFAVKGFTEALQIDLRLNAPHVKASLVMPGHIGTSIVINSNKILGNPEPENLSETDIQDLRERSAKRGVPLEGISDEMIKQAIRQQAIDFRDKAPLTAAQAAAIILDGVRKGKWRILVGEDAHVLDRLVRANPETEYDASFTQQLIDEGLSDGLFFTGQND
jgi:NAD(P)-dependent dehydrogenase (short-subunit alcohol dehydrogenase family)